MKLFPRTLLGQTAFYLGALLLFVQAIWFLTAKYLILVHVRPSYGEQIVDMVAMAQELIERQPPGAAPASAPTLRLPSFGMMEIVPDSLPRPELVPHRPHDTPGDLTSRLQERFGPSALSLAQKDAEVSWLRFPARGQLFWLKLTMTSMRPISYAKLWFVSLEIALAVGGAYLIVFRLTKKLRYVTAAAKAIGEGKPPEILEPSGPEEIRSLCEGFNQMSRDLLKLEADRRLMLAGISHDLKTPLARLRLAVDLAATRAEPEIAAGMTHDVEDMDAILKQFLDYARDGTEEPLARHDLNDLVREVCARYAARGVRIEMKLGMLPPFRFRRLAIVRAVTNLIDNAVRYGRAGIEVVTRLENQRAEVVVADQGPGIQAGKPADYVKAFARENSARSETGAGLGLTIVDRIVRSHAGELSIENRQPTGLLVKMQLPTAEA